MLSRTSRSGQVEAVHPFPATDRMKKQRYFPSHHASARARLEQRIGVVELLSFKCSLVPGTPSHPSIQAASPRNLGPDRGLTGLVCRDYRGVAETSPKLPFWSPTPLSEARSKPRRDVLGRHLHSFHPPATPAWALGRTHNIDRPATWVLRLQCYSEICSIRGQQSSDETHRRMSVSW